MSLKTLPILTLATYRMGWTFSIRVTGNINLITVGLEPTGERRSTRNAKKVNYKALHNRGNTPFLTMGKTAVSEHLVSTTVKLTSNIRS